MCGVAAARMEDGGGETAHCDEMGVVVRGFR